MPLCGFFCHGSHFTLPSSPLSAKQKSTTAPFSTTLPVSFSYSLPLRCLLFFFFTPARELGRGRPPSVSPCAAIDFFFFVRFVFARLPRSRQTCARKKRRPQLSCSLPASALLLFFPQCVCSSSFPRRHRCRPLAPTGLLVVLALALLLFFFLLSPVTATLRVFLSPSLLPSPCDCISTAPPSSSASLHPLLLLHLLFFLFVLKWVCVPKDRLLTSLVPSLRFAVHVNSPRRAPNSRLRLCVPSFPVKLLRVRALVDCVLLLTRS